MLTYANIGEGHSKRLVIDKPNAYYKKNNVKFGITPFCLLLDLFMSDSSQLLIDLVFCFINSLGQCLSLGMTIFLATSSAFM